MKWSIALGCGHGCLFWNGWTFGSSEAEAAKFFSKELAEKAMWKIFDLEGWPEDPEDAEFKRRLYVQAVTP